MDLILEAAGVRKVFNRRTIFDGISFRVVQGGTLLISGRNGSGKSTLVKILAGVLSPTAGDVTLAGPPQRSASERTRWVGFVSPYLQLYEEFTAMENLHLALSLRGARADSKSGTELLDLLGLADRRHDPVRTFSSGMKQRVKYAFALVHRPPVLILDEPMANLDAEGIEAVRGLMRAQCSQGILVVATNELTDVERYEERVDLHGAR